MALGGIPSIAPSVAVGGSTSSTNLVTNGGFETNTTGWSNGTTAATLTRITSDFHSGAASLQLEITGADGRGVTPYTPGGDLPQSAFTASVMVKAGNAEAEAKTCTLRLTTRPNNSATDFSVALTDDWQRISGSKTPAASQTELDVYVGIFSGGEEGDLVFVDDVQLEMLPYATPYIETDGAAASRTRSKWVA